jgi:hypothetical protein
MPPKFSEPRVDLCVARLALRQVTEELSLSISCFNVLDGENFDGDAAS